MRLLRVRQIYKLIDSISNFSPSDSFSSSSFPVPLEPTIRKGGSSCGISLLAPDPVKKVIKTEAECSKCKSSDELKNLVQ